MTRGNWRPSTAAEWLWGAEPMRWRRVYSGRADQVASARKFARELFAGTGREEDVSTVVAELCSNAIRHTRSGEGPRGWFGLEVTFGDLAYIGVTDLGGGCVPLFRSKKPGCELDVGGRGLQLVAELAVFYGIHGSSELGHTVWADLALAEHDRTGSQTELASVS
ncbi:ATP-binding protein [Actinomadura adrarensis]|uniref:ATP-binding protein n=1 Tax=Actinomadura adrarensis TaxID=1819600 RepID=A0ABW3CQH8_9ACTN